MADYRVMVGDCRRVMAAMEPDSIDSIVTDPPYGLSFMGKDWDHGVPGVEFWGSALRVAKPGAHLLAFGGTRTFHRLAVAIEDAGWEIRDCVMWVYGGGFPKSHNLKGDFAGYGTALKPAWEPIIVARKPLVGTVAQNVLRYRTGAINIDACRIPFSGKQDEAESKAKNQHADFESGPITNKVYGKYDKNRDNYNPPGRWPANFTHDGSEEVVALFPVTSACQKPARTGKRGGSGFGMFDDEKSSQAMGTWPADTGGSAARFFYCAKASKADRDEGCDGLEVRQTIGGGGTNDPNGDDVCGKYGSVKAPARNHHPTVKPTNLMRYLCRLVTPPGGLVLDPFCGSGSTGKAAIIEGFRFTGIELNNEYAEIAEARLAKASESAGSNNRQLPLFDGVSDG